MRPELLFIIPIILLGWGIGAVVNYFSDFLPIRRRPVAPFCLQCQERIDWLNYLIWPRRCNKCNERRASRVWYVEIIFALATLGLWISPPERLGLIIGLIWLVYFGIIIVIDVEHHLILHPMSWLGAVLGLATGIWLHGWLSTLIGGVVGFGVMLVFYWLGILYVRFVNRRKGQTIEEGDAFGFGDVNLSGVIGLLLGWPGILAGLVIAVLFSGAFMLVFIITMLITRRFRPNMALPYGPFLAASAIYLLFLR
jgi:prepilin signal peptidase PulO-like enzyme (type II secretory pathway)